MLTIVDYGMGNLFSIRNMLKKVGYLDVAISSDADDIRKADRIILPGVGAFDAAMTSIEQLGLREALGDAATVRKIPVLGICLGMQLLLEKSEEGRKAGLGWIPGENVRFSFAEPNNLKIPHMGWNEIVPSFDSPLFKGFDEEITCYFVHSYHAKCSHEENVVATTQHGYDFPCIIAHENVIGMQFHPEKSHKYGKQLFKNFLEMTC